MSFKVVIALVLVAAASASGLWFWQRSHNSECVQVLFMYGFGGKGNDWLKKNYQTVFQDRPGFHYVGDLSITNGQAQLEPVAGTLDMPNEHPFFTVSLRNHAFESIPELGDDVEASTELVRASCQCELVCLVAFSLGGVVCRDYLVRRPREGKVDRLVTISSPYQGSAFAFLIDFPKRVRAQPEGSLARELGGTAFDQLNSPCQEHHIDLYAKSLAMLKPPKPENYVDWWNHQAHPTNVRYDSLGTTNSAMHYSANHASQDAGKLADGKVIDPGISSADADLVHMGIDSLTNNAVSFGDGFVAVDSQDKATLPAMNCAKVLHKKIEDSSTHFNDLLQKELVSLNLQKR